MKIIDVFAAAVWRIERAVCLVFGWLWSQSYVVRANLLVVACWLTVDAVMLCLGIIGLHTDNPGLPLMVLPFYILLTSLGVPWAHSYGVDGMRADLAPWSANNLYYEILKARGVYINATLIGFALEAWKWWTRRRRQEPSLHQSRQSRRSGIATLLVVLAVVTMGIVQWTPYGRSTRLASAWGEVYRFQYFPVIRPAPGDSGGHQLPVGVERVINAPTNTPKGRHDLAQLAMAIEDAAGGRADHPAAVAIAEHNMSAALLCIASSREINYRGVGLPIFWILQASIDTPSRAVAFESFLRRLKGGHTLPAGDGCNGNGQQT